MKRFVCLCAILVLGACRREFDPKGYANPETLFGIGLKEFKAKHWGNATKAFEQLTRDLPARDPLLPPSYFYLGKAQDHAGDHLLAAQSFSRVADAFPEDTLADDAFLESGLSYAKMWRKPQLDAQYGERAISTLQTMVALYPDSPLVPRANEELAKLDNMFAAKDLETADYYIRRGANDSGVLYLRDVIRLHPTATATRDAYIMLYDTYKKMRYDDDARDTCQAMLKNYPNDREVRAKCGSESSAAASTPRT